MNLLESREWDGWMLAFFLYVLVATSAVVYGPQQRGFARLVSGLVLSISYHCLLKPSFYSKVLAPPVHIWTCRRLKIVAIYYVAGLVFYAFHHLPPFFFIMNKSWLATGSASWLVAAPGSLLRRAALRVR